MRNGPNAFQDSLPALTFYNPSFLSQKWLLCSGEIAANLSHQSYVCFWENNVPISFAIDTTVLFVIHFLHVELLNLCTNSFSILHEKKKRFKFVKALAN